MTVQSFERYGLTSNPFRDLASDSLEDIEIFHVNLQFDEALRNLREEVLERENRAVVAVVGPLGAGKTERLRLAQSDARARGATAVYVDAPARITGLLSAVSTQLQASAKLGGFARAFSPPAWYRGLTPFVKADAAKLDPLVAGRAAAEALNALAPSFLLINDVHNLSATNEATAFARWLGEVADGIKPGVLVMFGSYAAYWAAVTKGFPSLASRINRTFSLPTLAPEEAGLLLAKKLLAKRLVEDLDPLYPFDSEAVALLNQAAGGNPRRLLELADLAIEYGVTHRAYRVDREMVRGAIASRPIPPAGTGPMPAAPPGSTGTVAKPANSPAPSLRPQGDSP